jgi:hypothetical protein
MAKKRRPSIGVGAVKCCAADQSEIITVPVKSSSTVFHTF